MKQITFVADGKTKNFHFTFPFFMKSDVVIAVDSQPATKYNLICIKNGLNADIPFAGGEIQFVTPPRQGSVITVQRKLPIHRLVDFQPTTRYNPTAHNQDMNYILEILKDMHTAVESLGQLSSDIVDKNTLGIITQQIAQITAGLDEIKNAPAAVDLSEINSAINTLNASISDLNTQCNQMGTQIESISNSAMPANADYVIASQLPTTENNYTWYRKYASGWVEQGGHAQFGTVTVLPIAMSDANYTITITAASGIGGSGTWTQERTSASFKCVGQNYGSQFITGGTMACWRVSGMAAG